MMQPSHKPRLIYKLFGGFLLVALTGVAVAALLVDRNVAKNSHAQVEERLGDEATMLAQITANALFGEIDPTDTALNESVHALGDAVHTHLTLLANDGTVVADSESLKPLELPKQAEAPEITAARASGLASAVRAENGVLGLYVARSIVRDGKTLGFARSSVGMDVVRAHTDAVRARMAWGGLVSALAALVLGLAISMGIVRPVRALAAGAKRIGDGDFSQPIAVSSNDELGQLAGAFNDMSANLATTMASLDTCNRDMRLVLDNVPEGLVTIDRDGKMAVEHSAALVRWFGPPAAGDTFWDYLARAAPGPAADFQVQWGELIEDVMPLELTIDQLPRRVAVGDDLYELSYSPILENDVLSKMLVVVSDVTARVAAERAEEVQRETAQMFERMMRDKAGFMEFVREGDAQVTAIVSEVRPPLAETKRALHTLKGNSGIFGLKRLSWMCHELETRMEDDAGDLGHADRKALEDAWTAFSKKLRSLLGEQDRTIVVHDDEYSAVVHAIRDGRPRTEVVSMISDWRLERATERLARFGEQAKELAQRLGKGEINVVVSPDPIRIVREAWAPFWSSFTHAVRNAVDHGLETPDARRAAGKPPVGTLCLSLGRRGTELVVELNDDGRGIDWTSVKARAARLGLPAATHDDLVGALFHDGVSTAEQVSDVSGRGVGLGAVRAECERLGGRVTVMSEAGIGTTFRFCIPSRSVNTTVRHSVKPSAPPPRKIA